MSPVPPPWTLHGTAIVLVERGGLLGLVRYQQSPVGPYNEVAHIGWTRRGWRVTAMAVDSLESVQAGWENWGYPKVWAALNWQQRGRNLTFDGDGQRWRWRLGSIRIPVRLRASTLQERRGRMVRVPVTVAGRLRPAFAGRRWGLCLEEMTLTVMAPHAID